jgi:methylated-DNA-protein-cysteine methyltransferase-like protein
MKKSRKESFAGNSFFKDVYAVARLIPKGRVTSYRAIASYLGSAGSSRMVGWAMNSSSSQKPPVPAHRVVNRNGLLTGKHHFGGPTLMQQLLENEGIRVEDDQVMDFEKLFWDPAIELDLEKTRPKKKNKKAKAK